MNIEGLVQSLSAGAVAAVAVGAVARKYWTGRELHAQAEFTQAVQQIVDRSVVDMISRQSEFEKRQGRHLDRQDLAIAALRRDIKKMQRQVNDRLPGLPGARG